MPLQLGVLVPKKLVRRAIDRHTLKRLSREASRLILHPGAQGFLLVRLTKPVHGIPYSARAAWWNEFQQLFQRLPVHVSGLTSSE